VNGQNRTILCALDGDKAHPWQVTASPYRHGVVIVVLPLRPIWRYGLRRHQADHVTKYPETASPPVCFTASLHSD
jgi:hypothetical protein